MIVYSLIVNLEFDNNYIYFFRNLTFLQLTGQHGLAMLELNTGGKTANKTLAFGNTIEHRMENSK